MDGHSGACGGEKGVIPPKMAHQIGMYQVFKNIIHAQACVQSGLEIARMSVVLWRLLN